MKLYLLTQSESTGYDTYDSCIVCAENEEEVKLINPNYNGWERPSFYTTWASKPENVECILLGNANKNIKKGIVLSSFNAG